MEKIRWGVLSTANIGRTQVIPAIFRAENAEMSAISSRGDRVYAAARELGIPKAYESYEALLDDPEIDAVYIPLPNNLHKEWVIKAAEKGKHVLCEKPAALSAQEAKEMIEACEANGVKFMEAFMYQLHPQHARVKEIIASGEIGEVKLIKSSHSFYLNNREGDIRMDKTMGGGSIYDVGSYCVQVIRHLTDSEPVKVQAIAELDEATGIDLTSTVYMKMDNGVKAMFDCSFDMINRNEYEVIGTEGKIKVPFAFRPDINGGIGKVVIQNNGMTREEKIYGDIYRMEIEQFSRAILDGGEPVITTESTLKNMAVLDKCYESIQNT
ncbi:Gfo/Idh/MocA family protein [Planococcus sp. 107-1]|uniref:Gfo/Idh/MocA family protein n=1 Tax=Planococcus sp. 107-1 TaxID=2908840 RepID=UPI001F3F464C|nr:Gfo/Idh/MocA family oxidoreductase [Planococcus sp. 107-1]UJF27488.1 Gfo/Idh/MocA family oxidoreductase [Planococcus sp. 107-1]